MKPIHELAANQCRFPLTDSDAPNLYPIAGGAPSYPHLFCGEATDAPPYCPTHTALCYRGGAAPVRKLEAMIVASDETVGFVRGKRAYMRDAHGDVVSRFAKRRDTEDALDQMVARDGG